MKSRYEEQTITRFSKWLLFSYICILDRFELHNYIYTCTCKTIYMYTGHANSIGKSLVLVGHPSRGEIINNMFKIAAIATILEFESVRLFVKILLNIMTSTNTHVNRNCSSERVMMASFSQIPPWQSYWISERSEFQMDLQFMPSTTAMTHCQRVVFFRRNSDNKIHKMAAIAGHSCFHIGPNFILEPSTGYIML